MKSSYNPKLVAAFFKSHGLPEPVFEHRFHPDRKWRFDVAWPEHRVAIEVQGGIWIRGGHSRGAGQRRDWEKFNEAAVLGWAVLQCEPKDLMKKETADLVTRALHGNPAKTL